MKKAQDQFDNCGSSLTTSAQIEDNESMEKSCNIKKRKKGTYQCAQCDYTATLYNSLFRHKESKHEGL